MMQALAMRGNAIARAAQRKRLSQIAASLSDHGLRVEVAADSIAVSGRGLIQKWLSEPLVRFAGRYGQ